MAEELNIPTNQIALADFSATEGRYSNTMQMIVTAWDFRMLFSEIAPGSPGKLVAHPRASIIMSPQHFKAMLGVMNERLADYEKTNGTIQWQKPEPPRK